MTTTNTVLPATCTPVEIDIGTSYAIIENQGSDAILWTTSGISSEAWHKLQPTDAIKIDFAIHAKNQSKNSIKLCVTKD